MYFQSKPKGLSSFYNARYRSKCMEITKNQDFKYCVTLRSVTSIYLGVWKDELTLKYVTSKARGVLYQSNLSTGG